MMEATMSKAAWRGKSARRGEPTGEPTKFSPASLFEIRTSEDGGTNFSEDGSQFSLATSGGRPQRRHWQDPSGRHHGFSLIELLVVISIIAVITGLSLTNFLGARERARDTRRKSDLQQLKNALRLYYNDYNKYPASDTNTYVAGCGTAGTDKCPGTCTGGEFAAGGADGCATVYMRTLPTEYTYDRHPNKPGDTDDFLLSVTLENASDEDSAASQAHCGITPAVAKQYVVCAD